MVKSFPFFFLASFFVGIGIAAPRQAKAQLPITRQAAPPVLTKKPLTIRFGQIGADLIADDPRLTTVKVGGIAPRIYLAELLQQWQVQAGVGLEARDDTKDDTGRWQILVGLRDAIPLVRAMNALRSTMSESGAIWLWQRSGNAPNYTYRLIRPATLNERNAAWKKAVQDDYEDSVARIKHALTLSDADLQQAAKDDPTGVIARLLEPNGVTRQGMTAFFSNLSEEEQLKVLRGESIQRNESQLDAVGKKFAETYSLASVANIKLNGVPVQVPVPPHDRIEIHTTFIPSSIIPYLAIMVGDEHGMGGWDYTLGFKQESQWRSRLEKEIYTDYDSKKPTNTSLLTTVITPPVVVSPPKDELLSAQQKALLARRPLEPSLLELAQSDSLHINFFARLPQTRGSGSVKVYGRTLGDICAELRKDNIADKWQGDILLLVHTAEFNEVNGLETRVPYPAFRFAVDHLDTWAEAKQVPLSDLLTLSRLMTKEQWIGLGKQYINVFEFFDAYRVDHYYDSMVAMASAPPEFIERMASPGGVAVGELTPAMIKAFEITEKVSNKERWIYRERFVPGRHSFSSTDCSDHACGLKATVDSPDPDLYKDDSHTYWRWFFPVPKSWKQLAK